MAHIMAIPVDTSTTSVITVDILAPEDHISHQKIPHATTSQPSGTRQAALKRTCLFINSIDGDIYRTLI